MDSEERKQLSSSGGTQKEEEEQFYPWLGRMDSVGEKVEAADLILGVGLQPLPPAGQEMGRKRKEPFIL